MCRYETQSNSTHLHPRPPHCKVLLGSLYVNKVTLYEGIKLCSDACSGTCERGCDRGHPGEGAKDWDEKNRNKRTRYVNARPGIIAYPYYLRHYGSLPPPIPERVQVLERVRTASSSRIRGPKPDPGVARRDDGEFEEEENGKSLLDRGGRRNRDAMKEEDGDIIVPLSQRRRLPTTANVHRAI